MYKTIEYKDNEVIMIDQRKLPTEEIYNHYRTHEGVAEAIETMVIRGAPAIGVAAAMGIALGAYNIRACEPSVFWAEFEKICERIRITRPTAVNLFWAIERMKKLALENKSKQIRELTEILVKESIAICEEDIEINKRMGENGAALIKSGQTILTHCNAGALATAGHGTALGVIKSAHLQGKKIRVFADETRPFLQGARLTAWELVKDGIETHLITDNMAAYFMSKGQIDMVIVGSDRIAGNGDIANKIGTMGVAILAKNFNIPFYVAAPLSTIDRNIKSGEEIPIEQRTTTEVTELFGTRIAPEGVIPENPAFDVTPNKLVTAIITEVGILYPPFVDSIREAFKK